MKTLESITISGILVGKVWAPWVYAWKDFKVTFTPDDRPFTREWDGLPDALDHIVNDGDFQSCGVVDAQIKVTWKEGRDFITRYRELNLDAKAIAAFKATPDATEAYLYSDWED